MQKTVLVVEDNDDERKLYVTIVEHFGYEVLQAANGTDGMEQARTRRPTAILLDVHMPDMNGLDVAALLKNDASTAQIPLIAMTVHRISASTVHEAGCEEYLPKPFMPSELGRLLTRLIGPP
jgi:two-component system cell cycle response regulator DivK